jgi:short-subunit dehydrogenase
MSSTSRTALVTGATSGIGLATARLLVERGYAVIGTSRDPAKIPAADLVEGVRYRPLDLRDVDTIDGFLASLRSEAIAVDVLVNNAGESQSGPLEEIPLEALRRIMNLNVLGPVHLTQGLLPGMRERGFGRVVMVGSMLASFPLAFRSSYVASKAALKGFATAARYEMAPYGVWLTTVEPGSIRTGISQRRTKYVSETSPHAPAFHKMLKILDANEREGITAERVARTIVEAIEADEPAPLYAVGSNAPAVFALRRALPRRAVERIINRAYGVSKKPRPPLSAEAPRR